MDDSLHIVHTLRVTCREFQTIAILINYLINGPLNKLNRD